MKKFWQKWMRLGVWLYVVIWLIIIVGLQYRAEMQLRKLQRLRTELPKKRALYLTLAAQLSQAQSYQAIKNRVMPLGLHPPLHPPKRIPHE